MSANFIWKDMVCKQKIPLVKLKKTVFFPSRSDLFAQKKIKTSIKMFNNFDFGRGFFMASEQNKVSTVAPINHFVPLLT